MMKYSLKIIVIILFINCNIGIGQLRVSINDLFYSNNIVTYDDKPFNGIAYDLSSTGNWIWYEANYKNGELNGIERIWYNPNQIMRETNYKSNKKNGIAKTWYPNGKIMNEREFTNGDPDGLLNAWYSNGQERYKGMYLSHYKGGQLTEFYKSGEIKGKGNFRIKEVKDEILVPSTEFSEAHYLWLDNFNIDWHNNFSTYHKNGKIKRESKKNNDLVINCWNEIGNKTICHDTVFVQLKGKIYSGDTSNTLKNIVVKHSVIEEDTVDLDGNYLIEFFKVIPTDSNLEISSFEINLSLNNVSLGKVKAISERNLIDDRYDIYIETDIDIKSIK